MKDRYFPMLGSMPPVSTKKGFYEGSTSAELTSC